MDARTGFVTQLAMDYVEAIEFAGGRFDFVELLMDGAGERRRLLEREDAVNDALDAAGIDLLVHLPFVGIDVASPFEHVRTGAIREVEAAIDAAASLGAEKGVVHAGSSAWEPAWEVREIRPRVFESLRHLDAYGVDRGVELCVENIPGAFVGTRDFPELFEETDANMTLDTGHARIDGLESEAMASFVDSWAERISHVHLNDTRVPRDEHLPFGSGTLDFDRILGAFPDDWDGTLSLEVFTADFGYVAESGRRLDDLLG